MLPKFYHRSLRGVHGRRVRLQRHRLEQLEERRLLAADLIHQSSVASWRPKIEVDLNSVANDTFSSSSFTTSESVDHVHECECNHDHAHDVQSDHSPGCQCEQCLGVNLEQGDDPDHSPGCQCEQCLGVAHVHEHQHESGHVHAHEHHHGNAVEGYDRHGNWIFVEATEPEHGGFSTLDPLSAVSPSQAPLADTFKLHSLPGSQHTIYLDFDGHTTTGTTWNSASGRASITSPAYDPSFDGSNFNNQELALIQRVWQRVAEDFSPFQVNVTTEDPGAAALTNSGGSDTQWGTRVVITEDWDNCGCGGFAYLNSFSDPTDEPVFVFNSGEIGVSAASTHEVGHALGLSHDGLTTGAAYYSGHASGDPETGWGPIMGSGYTQNMTTWDAGDYFNSNNQENDWQIITSPQNGFGYRTDDHGNNSGSATLLNIVGPNANDSSLSDVGGFGVIELDTDTDWFSFEATNGLLNLTINPYVTETFVNTGAGYSRIVETTAVPPDAEQFSNLDVLATLYDSNLNVVATSNPNSSLIASLTNVSVSPGTYFLSVDGVGVGNWAQSNPVGYDQSVSRGMFAISGTIPLSNARLFAVPDSATTPAGQSVTINVLANDFDPQGGSFSISSLSNPSNGSISESSGVITYTPNQGFDGTDSFGYTITDDQGDEDSATVTITVNPPRPPILLVDDDQGATFERFYTSALTANNLQHDVWTVSSAGLPTTANLADYSAVIWQTGNNFSASDGGFSTSEQTAVAAYLDGGGRMFIAGQDILYNSVTSDFLTNYLKVSQFTNDVQGLTDFVGVSGNAIGDGLNLAFQLPSDFSTDWSDTLAPTADAEGVFYRNSVNSNAQPFNTVAYSGSDFRVVFMAAPFEGINSSAADPNNQKSVLGRIMNYLLGEVNQPPTATNNSYSTNEDTVLTTGNLLTDGVADSDPDGDPLTTNITPVSGPTNGSVTLQSDGSFAYTPNLNFNGNDSFVYQITDGNEGSDTATVTVTVNPVNDAPTATNDAITTDQNTAVVISPLTNDNDVDGDALSINTFVQGTDGTVAENGNESLLYTPNSGFIGNDSFTYSISDGNGGTATATVNITVLEVNYPPVAANDSATTDEDVAVNIYPLENDTDANGDTLSIDAFSQGTNGTVTNNGDGALTYAPNNNFNGNDSFTYTVSDESGGSDTATVSVTINAINDDPTAADDAITTDQDTAVVISPLANDNDVDGDPLNIFAFSQATNGTVTDNGSGTLLYSPNDGHAGSDSFIYTISDGNGGTDTATVTIDTIAVSDPKIVIGVLSSVETATWTTVSLPQSYNSLIVVATPVHTSGNAPVATRIGNITRNSFDIRVQRIDGNATDLTDIQVQYVVVDEGVYTEAEHGITMEAVKFTSTITARKNNWVGQQRTYANTYSSPVVLGQVMSYNQTAHSVFWASGSTQSVPPDANTLTVGKHIGEDPNTTRLNEVVGYLVLETGNGTLGNLNYSAAVGSDIVRGTQNGTSQYSVSGITSISSAVLSQAAMDGGDGGYAVLSGVNPIDGTTINLAIDEDQLGDGERSHTTEQVAYVAFQTTNANPIANDDSATTDEDVLLTVSVLDNDSDANGDPLTVTTVTQGTHGSVAINLDGSVAYTPNANFNGSDAFTYTISDGNGGSDTATVNVTIDPVNDDPTAADDAVTTDQNTAVVIVPLANDDDLDGDTLSISTFAQAANGTVTDNGNGSLLYTPSSGFIGNDAFTYTVSDGNGGTDTATVNITVNEVIVSGPNLATGIVSNVGTDGWKTVTLANNYTSMVVVATLVYTDDNVPLVTRITNASGDRFDVRVQRADGLTGSVSGVDVHYIVVEEGVYTQAEDGITMEAVTFTSSVTAGRGGWGNVEARSYANNYSSPVVVGQVMSFNDASFSVFWARGSARARVPNNSTLFVGKHAAEDPTIARNDETVGYIVIEAGSGTINGFDYSAGVGSDIVRGTDNGSYSYNTSGLANATSAVLSSAAMDGGDGGWPVLHGSNPVSGSTINLAIDEDQLRDSERRHTTEQIAFLAISPTTPPALPEGSLRDEPEIVSNDTTGIDLFPPEALNAILADVARSSNTHRNYLFENYMNFAFTSSFDLESAVDVSFSLVHEYGESQLRSAFDYPSKWTGLWMTVSTGVQDINTDNSVNGRSALSEVESSLFKGTPSQSHVDEFFAQHKWLSLGLAARLGQCLEQTCIR